MTPDDTETATNTLAKTFDPAAIEAKWYAHWETNGLFRPERPEATPFTIVNPPPNVTGSLHIGHALDNTLQDVVVRYERLRGKDALWVVGTDHAGIATQMVVERELEKRQDKRTNYTREDFVAKVWEWKHESGGTITGQLRRLGCSMDWSREQFTMDPHFTRAVTKVFVDLFNEGLIYRDKRLVNWDPKLKTAISDLEVENREVQGHMWHFKYPLAGGETYSYVERDADGAVVFEEQRDYISIATTRPETMLGDGAVAVHPSDARYAPIVGKLCEIPVGPREHRRLIPIITDSYPDPDFGSGAVKITGAHDENDYGVAQRNGIPMYRLMDEVAAMRTDGVPYAQAAAQALAIARGEATATVAEIDALNLVPDEYRGLDRYVARERVIADIDAEGLMIAIEDKTIVQPFGDRGGVVIEPMLTDQWYVDAKTLAQPPLEAVRSGAIEIVPKSWEKTFFNWMENIQPWCVSRQLWWGHRIPAWYCPMPSDKLAGIRLIDRNERGNQQYRLRTIHFVCETQDSALAEIAAEHGVAIDGLHVCESKDEYARHLFEGRDKIPVLQDQDVLDTWFSSALWPFATLGWPETDPPQHGEVARSDGGGGQSNSTAVQQAHPLPPFGVPPRAGEDRSLLARHYPNDLLISGFDILFFWDARMAMQGMHIMGEPPWKRLYLHGLVRAPDGQKMSKSKGNVVDPLLLIDKFGADALRFFMAAMESQGRDIKMDERRVEGYRNFATKLWNAARFCQSNGIAASTTLAAPAAKSAVNRWIIGEVVETVAALDQAMADLRFDAAANAIYHFVWDTFCDWYIELIKGSFDDETKAVAGWVLDQILVMLHPFMPFVTEELWHSMGSRPYELIVAKWPAPSAVVDAEAKREVELVIKVIDGIRSQRLEVGFKPGDVVPTSILAASDDALAIVNGNLPSIRRIARIQPALISISKYEGGDSWGTEVLDQFQINDIETTSFVSVQFPVGEITFLGFTQGFIDTVAEKSRLEKALAVSQKEAKSLAGRLSNPAFVEKAKPEAIAKARADHDHHAAEAERLAAALARLG